MTASISFRAVAYSTTVASLNCMGFGWRITLPPFLINVRTAIVSDTYPREETTAWPFSRPCGTCSENCPDSLHDEPIQVPFKCMAA